MSHSDNPHSGRYINDDKGERGGGGDRFRVAFAPLQCKSSSSRRTSICPDTPSVLVTVPDKLSASWLNASLHVDTRLQIEK